MDWKRVNFGHGVDTDDFVCAKFFMYICGCGVSES